MKKIKPCNTLTFKCPALLAEWNYSKNTINPDKISYGSKQKVSWICKKGHEWEANINNRYRGTGCPFCEGRRLSPVHNLAKQYPLLIKEWHNEKNVGWTPYDVTPGSARKFWWICNKKHEWQATVRVRTSLKQGCPYCNGKRASKTNNLAVKYPHLVSEWHLEKNKNLIPDNITSGSKVKIWWVCNWGHEWKAPVYSRTKGHGCPKCNFRSSKLEVRTYCELKHLFPDALWQSKIEKREVDIFIPQYNLAIEVDGWYWHKSDDRINADKRKDNLLASKGITLIRVADQRIVLEKNSLVVSYKNGEQDCNVIQRVLNLIVKNKMVSLSDLSKIKVYQMSGCYANEKEYNSILKCLPGPLIKNSVASNPVLVCEWDYQNNLLSPTQFSCGSKSKVSWICKKGHRWEATIGSRAAGRGCPFCGGKRPTQDNNLLIRNPELAKEWHPSKNGSLTPDMILSKSNKKVWWRCKKGHDWPASIDNRNQGTGCPYCTGRKATEHYNLAVKHPELLTQWYNEKNTLLTPWDVTPTSSRKVWWICSMGHIWEAKIRKRAMGQGCRFCKKDRTYAKEENSV
jgi:hypothetical protein